MLCCLLALFTIGPIGLAVTAPRARFTPSCCPGYSRLWLAATLGVLLAGCAAMAVLFWHAAPAESFFRHLCSVLPLQT
jgi:hypothetical protein